MADASNLPGAPGHGDAIADDIWSVLAHNHRIYYLVEDQRVVILDVILDAEIHSMEQG